MRPAVDYVEGSQTSERPGFKKTSRKSQLTILIGYLTWGSAGGCMAGGCMAGGAGCCIAACACSCCGAMSTAKLGSTDGRQPGSKLAFHCIFDYFQEFRQQIKGKCDPQLIRGVPNLKKTGVEVAKNITLSKISSPKGLPNQI